MHSGWFLVNNSGAASMKKEKDGVRIERPRGNGMDLLRAKLKTAPAPGQKFLLKAKFTAGSRSSSTTRRARASARDAT